MMIQKSPRLKNNPLNLSLGASPRNFPENPKEELAEIVKGVYLKKEVLVSPKLRSHKKVMKKLNSNAHKRLKLSDFFSMMRSGEDFNSKQVLNSENSELKNSTELKKSVDFRYLVPDLAPQDPLKSPSRSLLTTSRTPRTFKSFRSPHHSVQADPGPLDYRKFYSSALQSPLRNQEYHPDQEGTNTPNLSQKNSSQQFPLSQDSHQLSVFRKTAHSLRHGDFSVDVSPKPNNRYFFSPVKNLSPLGRSQYPPSINIANIGNVNYLMKLRPKKQLKRLPKNNFSYFQQQRRALVETYTSISNAKTSKHSPEQSSYYGTSN